MAMYVYVHVYVYVHILSLLYSVPSLSVARSLSIPPSCPPILPLTQHIYTGLSGEKERKREREKEREREPGSGNGSGIRIIDQV